MSELSTDLRGAAERGWFIECSRCANDHEYIGEWEKDALEVFVRLGWRVSEHDDDGAIVEDVFCPGCSGEGKR